MSKLARKPIDVSSVESSYSNNKLIIKGKHGELDLTIKSHAKLTLSDNQITIDSHDNAIQGLYCALIRNMIEGVQNQFSENLILKGVGYRAQLSGKTLNLNLGYSHPVTYTIADGVNVDVISPTELKLTGVDKQLVGQVAAEIIKLRPAKKDPYKEKGIKRIQDRIIKKVGKKVK